MTVAVRMLAYGMMGDLMDEYMRFGESTALHVLKKIVKVMISIFFGKYIRSLNNNDIARLLTISQNHEFPQMLRSIDYM